MEARVLGTTGDVTVCDCCGRSDLKKTVVIEIDGEIAHFGVVCAAHKLRFSALEVNRMARSADDQARKLARQAEDDRRARAKQHPLYIQGLAIRDALIAEFGFWTRCPNEDPRKGWYSLIAQAEAATA